MFNKLRSFCIENRYFTGGTNSQYGKFFDLAEAGASIHDLAVIICICSDHDDVETIEAKLKEIM